jgi:hypothetical protein
MKHWSGSAWVEKPTKVWSGSAWVAKPVKVWDGGQWVVRPPVVGGPTVYADTFDRANANLEASPVASGGWSWTHDGLIAGAARIASNHVESPTGDSNGSAYFTPDLGSADHYVQFSIYQIAAANGSFFCCRLQDRLNYIGIRANANALQVYRRVAGAFTSLYLGSPGSAATNDVFKIVVQGSNFTAYRNGAVLTGPTAIGAVLTATKAGLNARSGGLPMGDNFECGTL